jgi:hypothetical protein
VPDDVDPTDRSLDAATLVGLLADLDRLRFVAALALGATDIAAVRAAAGLDGRAVAVARHRLEEAGLVIVDADGTLVLVEAAFRRAARQAAARRPVGDVHEGVAEADARVLRTFVREGRITSIPMARAKRLVVLDWLAQRFEPGRRYSEQMVNAIIGQLHADTAAWRRHLVDEGFMDRDHGEYWRTGGTVPPP